MRLTYFGQSAFQLEADDLKLLIDPWISENPHTDATISDFHSVDAILVTHGAFDHLGDAPELAEQNEAPIICDFATHTALTRNGFPEKLLEGYIYGAVHNGNGWQAKVVEARHQSLFANEGIIGPALAYVVTIGDHRVYHMGDTSIFSDIELFGDLYEPTVTLVPVGETEGYFTELHPDEAALAASWLPSDHFIPMHYPPGSPKPAKFAELCGKKGVTDRSTIHLTEPGTSVEL
jgi:L-ascorbate metabolism protein UlaG (beta-lactamase superfamily)